MYHQNVHPLELADFMDELAVAGTCGGARCHSCPFFIPGNATREGKACASCPMRLYELARRHGRPDRQTGRPNL